MCLTGNRFVCSSLKNSTTFAAFHFLCSPLMFLWLYFRGITITILDFKYFDFSFMNQTISGASGERPVVDVRTYSYSSSWCVWRCIWMVVQLLQKYMEQQSSKQLSPQQQVGSNLYFFRKVIRAQTDALRPQAKWYPLMYGDVRFPCS